MMADRKMEEEVRAAIAAAWHALNVGKRDLDSVFRVIFHRGWEYGMREAEAIVKRSIPGGSR